MSPVYYSINLADFYQDSFLTMGTKITKRILNLPFFFLCKKLFILNIRLLLKLFNQRGSPWESKPLTACIRFTLIYRGSIMLMKNKLAGSPPFALEPLPAVKFHAM